VIRVALVGGGAHLRDGLRAALAGQEIELLDGAGVGAADVALVADDGEASGAERCRALAAVVPCVLIAPPGVALPSATAAALGARATVELPLDASALAGAMRVAAAAPALAAGGTVITVLSGAGGQGATTVADALARVLPEPVAALDLDLAGGALAARAGIADDPRDAGLAGEERPEAAFERLARPVPYGRLVPAPARPDLAWLVRDGLVSGLCRAARAAHRWVVADVGRPLGPTVEAVLAADLLLVVTRLDAAAVAATRRQLELLARLAVPDCAVRVVANAVRRRDAVRAYGLSGELGREAALVLPDAPAGGDELGRVLAAVPALVDGLRGVA
jgi:Flp pilus assembly CpaE family ATPase